MNPAGKRVMYQVEVTTQDGSDKRIGPMTNVKDVPAGLCESINRAVAAGKERDWRDARVVEIAPIATD